VWTLSGALGSLRAAQRGSERSGLPMRHVRNARVREIRRHIRHRSIHRRILHRPPDGRCAHGV